MNEREVYSRDGVPEILNLQSRGSQAKLDQIKQVRGVVVAKRLAGEPELDVSDAEPQAGESDRSNPEGAEDGQ
jgi:hypothetical protein